MNRIENAAKEVEFAGRLLWEANSAIGTAVYDGIERRSQITLIGQLIDATYKQTAEFNRHTVDDEEFGSSEIDRLLLADTLKTLLFIAEQYGSFLSNKTGDYSALMCLDKIGTARELIQDYIGTLQNTPPF